MRIVHIFAQNFCKFYGKNTLDTDFSMKTVLSGQNEVGKSTVKRIILDVLNCHDENDREITGIRPHDENGVEIDDVDIVRAVTFEIDLMNCLRFRFLMRCKNGRDKNKSIKGRYSTQYA